MLNPYEHEDAEQLTKSVETVVEPVSELIARADGQGAERAMNGARPDLVEPVLPPSDADFVVKARHTIFYMTRSSTCSGRRRSATSCWPAR